MGAMGGCMPISYGEVDVYAQRAGIIGEEFDRLFALITAMDAAFLPIANRPKDG